MCVWLSRRNAYNFSMFAAFFFLCLVLKLRNVTKNEDKVVTLPHTDTEKVSVAI